jgi:hypothetical protein
MTTTTDENSKLQQRIDDLEAYCTHLHTVLIGLLDTLPVPKRANYALLALAYRFSAKDENMLDSFLRWAHREIQGGRLTREGLIAQYAAVMPEHLQGKLEQIMKAYEADGVHSDCVRLLFAAESS